jgi:4-amino-4-deoxy-L-arabinose transferase-like glycosyltransferase
MKWKEPVPLAAVLILTAVTIACLLPFVGKAVHIDDPLYIWTARQIRSHPLDFYGFDVFWEKHKLPMAINATNPPLTAYYLAAIASVLGWSERALHLGFLLPAVLAVIGTYFLAKRFCAHPFAAAMGTIAMPVFLLCSTSLMCDTMMVACWVWTVLLWMRALEQGNTARLALAGLLIGVTALTKYFGVCLVPLLLGYSVMAQRRVGRSLIFLVIPILMLAAYQWYTQKIYGEGQLQHIADFSTHYRVGGGLISKALAGLSFSGGCNLLCLAALPMLWGRKGVWVALAGMVVIALLVVGLKTLGMFSVSEAGHVKWLSVAQIVLFISGGTALLVLAATDALRCKDALSVLLFLWIAGTFLFACGVNWTIAGRNILPMAPAAAILVIRRIESRQSSERPDNMRYLWCPLSISLAVGMMAAWGDYCQAGSARTAAKAMNEALNPRASVVGFEGHWGFQYYMDQFGAKPLDRDNLTLVSNEMIVVPLANSFIFPLPRDRVQPVSEYRAQVSKWVATISVPVGAGFYSDGWGPAPFIFGPTQPDQYFIFRVK